MKECLEQCLEPAKNKDNAMAQWVLRLNDQVVPRRSCQHLTPSELAPSNEIEVKKQAQFDAAIKASLVILPLFHLHKLRNLVMKLVETPRTVSTNLSHTRVMKKFQSQYLKMIW